MTTITGIKMRTIGEQLRHDDTKAGEEYTDDSGATWTVHKVGPGPMTAFARANYEIRSKTHAIDGAFIDLVTMPGFRKKNPTRTAKLAPAIMRKPGSTNRFKITDTLFESEQAAKDGLPLGLFVQWLIDTNYALEVEVPC